MFHAQPARMFMINLHTIFNITMRDGELNRVFKAGLQALSAQKFASQHMFRNQCLLRHGRVLHLTGYQDNSAVRIKRRAKRVMCVYLPFPCILYVVDDSIAALLICYYGESNDSWCCDTHSI
jgi:hypothetical protein